MAKVTIETPEGDKLGFLYARGLTLPVETLQYYPYEGDIDRHLSDVKHMNIRDDDLYLVTYPKCGTHWSWEIMSMLQRGSTEYEKSTKESLFIDLKSIPLIDARPSPRLLNGHLPTQLTPKGIFEKKIKIVNVMRNPKDAFVSLYYHYKNMSECHDLTKDFKTFLPFALGTYGLSLYFPYFQFMKEWEQFAEANPDQIINLFYEDLKENPVREIKKLNKFLGTNRDDKLIEQIAEACNFQNMKKADEEVKVKEGVMAQIPSTFMYRKGAVGDWKNHFTILTRMTLNDKIKIDASTNGHLYDLKNRPSVIICAGGNIPAERVEVIPYYPYNGDIERHFAEVKHLNIRDDDLYLVTYPKCGTHWTWEIMSMLQRGSSEHDKCTKETVFVDLKSVASIDERPSPRILNSHLPLHLTPKEIFEKKLKIVHVMRNPKDTFVSLYYQFTNAECHELTKDFGTFLPFALGTYGLSLGSPFFKFMKEWEQFSEENPDQMMNLFYEDLKENPVREIKKLNEFLGTNRDDKLIEQIAEACSFQNLKKADEEVKVKEGVMKTIPSSFMYRKGTVGDWKNHFTVSMNEQMDRWIEEKSQGCKFEFRYSL